MSWKTYVKTLLLTALLGGLILSAWMLIVDPYDNVWFSPPLERGLVSKNQRFSYPAVARNQRFDSLILGTSSVRLLNPSELDGRLGASFANLSMNAATPEEQSQILALFLRHHPEPRYVLLGVDDLWCNPHELHRSASDRPFPPWMYDENRWNDLLYLFNAATLEQSWRQFRYFLGMLDPRYGSDGYGVFVPPESEYDIEKVRGLLYEGAEPHLKPAVEPPVVASPRERSEWPFPNLPLLADMLGTLPEETQKVLISPPYHQFRMPAPGSLDAVALDECKARVGRMAADAPNTTLIDFMIRSDLTLSDESYWDPVHYRVGVASLFVDAIAEALRTQRDGDLYRVLALSDKVDN